MNQTPGRDWRAYLYVTFTGLCMGAADVVPGVSGGTMAFIMGIYEELLATIKGFNGRALGLLGRGRWVALWQALNLNFLAALGIGLAAAILSLARVVTWLYEFHQTPLFAFFFGLVLASIVVIGAHLERRAAPWLAVVAGTLIAYFVVRAVPVQMPHDPLTLLWCGAVAIIAMILPGISGSFILLILGQYHHVMLAVKSFDLKTILPFAIGAAGGLLVFSHILSWLLKRYHQVTIGFLVGFMVGSLWKIWPWRQPLETFTRPDGKEIILRETVSAPVGGGGALALAVGLCLLGFVLVLGLERLQRRLDARRAIGA